MNGQRISFKRVTFGVPLFKNTKETCFFTFKNAFNPQEKIKQSFVISSIDNELKQTLFFE